LSQRFFPGFFSGFFYIVFELTVGEGARGMGEARSDVDQCDRGVDSDRD
jgi:hypothetical protein